MTTATGTGWTCGKCGRGGLTSVTIFGGINVCALCLHEMQLQAKAGGWAVPFDGPGSHAWDLREMRAQTKRAETAEAEVRALREELDGLRLVVERLVATLDRIPTRTWIRVDRDSALANDARAAINPRMSRMAAGIANLRAARDAANHERNEDRKRAVQKRTPGTGWCFDHWGPRGSLELCGTCGHEHEAYTRTIKGTP